MKVFEKLEEILDDLECELVHVTPKYNIWEHPIRKRNKRHPIRYVFIGSNGFCKVGNNLDGSMLFFSPIKQKLLDEWDKKHLKEIERNIHKKAMIVEFILPPRKEKL